MNTQNPERATKQRLTGLIIKNSLFGEGHRLITLIEKDRAKIDIMAFGAGKEKSSRRSALLVGHIVECEVQRSKSDQLFSLKEIYVIQQFPQMTQDYTRISWFYLIAEILDISLELDTGMSSYEILLETLFHIDTEAEPAVFALLFIFNFLRKEGVFPHHSEDVLDQVQVFSSSTVTLGNGSLRFLSDSERMVDPESWKHKKLSSGVIKELLDIIVVTTRYHFQKVLHSIDLIQV